MDYSSAMLGGFLGGALATAGVFAAIVSIAIYVLLIIGWWKIFTKAGEAGWKSLIPFYNIYTIFKICWETKYFWFTLLISVLSGVLSAIPAVGGFLGAICSIALIVLYVMQNYKLAKAFGHGGGYTVGLIFLPNIFVLILGFGSSAYQGKAA